MKPGRIGLALRPSILVLHRRIELMKVRDEDRNKHRVKYGYPKYYRGPRVKKPLIT